MCVLAKKKGIFYLNIIRSYTCYQPMIALINRHMLGVPYPLIRLRRREIIHRNLPPLPTLCVSSRISHSNKKCFLNTWHWKLEWQRFQEPHIFVMSDYSLCRLSEVVCKSQYLGCPHTPKICTVSQFKFPSLLVLVSSCENFPQL